MALYKQKIDKEPVKSLFPKPKSGYHKWIKRQMNKLLRKRPIEDDEVGLSNGVEQVFGIFKRV